MINYKQNNMEQEVINKIKYNLQVLLQIIKKNIKNFTRPDNNQERERMEV